MTNILTFETIKLSYLRFLTPILICESFIESFYDLLQHTHYIITHTFGFLAVVSLLNSSS